MPASDTFVIAGGGLAGAKAAEALREQGYDGRIVLAAEENIRPYERPPLSKEYLQGKAGQDTIFVHPPDRYDANDVELLPGTAVTGIDRGRREVTLSGGGHLAYAKLLGPGGYDQVIFRGDAGKREFIAFWLSGGRVAAGMNVNIWDVTDAIQDLIRSGRPTDPARLADPAFPLEEAIV